MAKRSRGRTGPVRTFLLPASPGDRQRLVSILREKEVGLRDAADQLLQERNKPGVNIGAVNLALDRNQLERDACRARINQLRAGDLFTFPDQPQIDELEAALRALEDAVARSAAVNDLIAASDDLIRSLTTTSTA